MVEILRIQIKTTFHSLSFFSLPFLSLPFCSPSDTPHKNLAPPLVFPHELQHFPSTSSNPVWCLSYVGTYLSSWVERGFLWGRSSILLISGFWAPSTQEEYINAGWNDLNRTDTLKGSVDLGRYRYFSNRHPSLAEQNKKPTTNNCCMMKKIRQKSKKDNRTKTKTLQVLSPKTRAGLLQVPLTRAPLAGKFLKLCEFEEMPYCFWTAL